MAKSIFLTSALAAAVLAAPSCQLAGANSVSIVDDGYWQTQRFKTGAYSPPTLNITRSYPNTPLSPGLLFMAPNAQLDPTTGTGPKGNGPVIMTDKGELVFNGKRTLRPMNFVAQQYQGQPVLSYWTGIFSYGSNLGHGYGGVVIMDTTYKIIATVCPTIPGFDSPGHVGYKCPLDLHESLITERNTLLATAYNYHPADLSGISNGPKDGYVTSGMAVEIDIATNKVLFAWDSFDHVPVSDSHLPRGDRGNASAPMDYFHINSVQLVGENYLINCRHTFSSYLLSPSGDIIWTFNGDTGGDFGTLPAQGTFHWAHQSRIYNRTDDSFTLTLYNNDNGYGGPSDPPTETSGLSFRLPNNPGSSPAVLQRRVTHDPPLYAVAEGSYDPQLANGNQLLGFGPLPYVSEHAPDGRQLWSAQFASGLNANNYRAFKVPWSATPYYPPTLVTSGARTDPCKTGYVSWNGATDVDAWAVYTGARAAALKRIGQVDRAGFETSFGFGGRCVQVAAVRAGNEIRRSKVMCV